MNKLQLIAALASSLSLVATASAQTFHLNDLEYFETRGANVLVYNNKYAGIFADEKKAGVEMILRGVRVATGGGIRLTNAPEQWDIYPEVVSRDVDKSTSTISTELRYADYDFTSVMKVRPQGNGVVVSVVLDKPVPAALEGKAGLTLEFFPASYFGTSLRFCLIILPETQGCVHTATESLNSTDFPPLMTGAGENTLTFTLSQKDISL